VHQSLLPFFGGPGDFHRKDLVPEFDFYRFHRFSAGRECGSASKQKQIFKTIQ
jgi:hypothetical protein